MGTSNAAQVASSLAQQLKELENDTNLMRTSLGDESLAKDLEPRFRKLFEIGRLVSFYVDRIHHAKVDLIRSGLNNVVTTLRNQAALSNSDYITHRAKCLEAIDVELEAAKAWIPHLISAAIQARGFLEDDPFRLERSKTLEHIEDHVLQATKQIEHDTESAIESAKKLASEIESRARNLAQEIEDKARQTAIGVSFSVAQTQFLDAYNRHKWQLWAWGIASLTSVGLFVATAVFLLKRSITPGGDWHVALFETALRIVILSVAGAVATFCVRVFRAHMHMSEMNLHRRRVANSIESFVVAAQTPERRDVILANLVEAVVAFGNSGLLPSDEDTIGAQKLPGEAMKNVLGSFGPKT